MFNIKLDILLFNKKMSQRELHRRTGIRLPTINAYYNNYIKRMNVDDLIKICNALHCDLSDLLEYKYEEKPR
jgi:putative transcriptional regulator